jgi:hypothetical protein
VFSGRTFPDRALVIAVLVFFLVVGGKLAHAIF